MSAGGRAMRPIHICWKLSAFTGIALNTSANAASQARNSGRRYSAITQRYAYTTGSNGAGYGECAGYKLGAEVAEFGAGMAGAGQWLTRFRLRPWPRLPDRRRAFALNPLLTGGLNVGINTNQTNTLSVAKVGVNYKFGWGAPVAAKY